MKDIVTYEDFPSRGIDMTPTHIRVRVRHGTFPKPVKGGGINGAKATGKNSRFYWSRKDVEKWAGTRKKRKPLTA
jgi:predicted DNA-binding transcriptional regulator AlpA